MQEVHPLVFDFGMKLRNLLSLLLPVVRAFLLSRKFALCAFKFLFAFLQASRVWKVLPFRSGDKLFQSKINTNDFLFPFWFDRSGLYTDRHIPITIGRLFEVNSFGFLPIDGTMNSNFDVSELWQGYGTPHSLEVFVWHVHRNAFWNTKFDCLVEAGRVRLFAIFLGPNLWKSERTIASKLLEARVAHFDFCTLFFLFDSIKEAIVGLLKTSQTILYRTGKHLLEIRAFFLKCRERILLLCVRNGSLILGIGILSLSKTSIVQPSQRLIPGLSALVLYIAEISTHPNGKKQLFAVVVFFLFPGALPFAHDLVFLVVDSRSTSSRYTDTIMHACVISCHTTTRKYANKLNMYTLKGLKAVLFSYVRSMGGTS